MAAIGSNSHRFSHWLQYAALRGFIAFVGVLPRRVRGAIGTGLGRLAYSLGIRKRVVFQNLNTAFPGIPQKGLQDTARRCFEHFGHVAVSLAELPKLSREALNDWVFMEGLEGLDRAVAGGNGGLVISGHLGNWEVIGAMAARLGYPVSFVVTTQRNKLVENWLNRLREQCGVEIIQRKDALRGVLSALKRNRVVAILIDQDAHQEGVFVPFFGKLSSTPRGPAVFHLRTGAPLIFMASSRIPGERYCCQMHHVTVAEGAGQEEIMATLTAKLEEQIRRTPEQWFWMHKRWKTLPPASLS
ncbi:MAG: lysophospholipid acyltransferase family protein [Calditrichaeota bacterium]|nr:lysophospholipid acyltransferase family protein [Calditrichota bacterium]MCB9391933.1 lysophospholipid acyltransferase family protein [Calditrichota bacterium]